MRKKSNKPLYHCLPTGIYLKIPIDVKCSYVFFFFLTSNFLIQIVIDFV